MGVPSIEDHYRTPPGQSNWLRRMLPSTFYFPTQQPTAGLPERTAAVELFCREPVSHAHLLNDCNLPACCRVDLAHDTAFALADSPFLAPYQNRPGRHILIVLIDHPDLVVFKHGATLGVEEQIFGIFSFCPEKHAFRHAKILVVMTPKNRSYSFCHFRIQFGPARKDDIQGAQVVF